MEALNFDPVGDVIAARDAQAQAQELPGGLGRDEFLKLLVAQLENQNPLEPAKDTEFVAQLATFSSLEQLISANDNLTALAVGQSNLINSQALGLIGKDALVEAGDEIRIAQGNPDQIVYALPKQANAATLTIYDENGTPLRVFDLQTTPNGRIELDWDGTDAQGNAVADGSYRFEVNATDAEGEPLALALFRSLPIEGVNFGSEGVSLVSGDQTISFATILEIRAGS